MALNGNMLYNIDDIKIMTNIQMYYGYNSTFTSYDNTNSVANHSLLTTDEYIATSPKLHVFDLHQFIDWSHEDIHDLKHKYSFNLYKMFNLTGSPDTALPLTSKARYMYLNTLDNINSFGTNHSIPQGKILDVLLFSSKNSYGDLNFNNITPLTVGDASTLDESEFYNYDFTYSLAMNYPHDNDTYDGFIQLQRRSFKMSSTEPPYTQDASNFIAGKTLMFLIAQIVVQV